MKWKPIKRLTDAEVATSWHLRLMVWNPCQGPYHVSGHANYFTADSLREAGWEKYLILPEAD